MYQQSFNRTAEQKTESHQSVICKVDYKVLHWEFRYFYLLKLLIAMKWSFCIHWKSIDEHHNP